MRSAGSTVIRSMTGASAGVRGRPEAKIHFYVMPHTPGNTTANWRRQFYGDLGHGAKVLNLFEFRPVQAAYTENHCSDPRMYQAIRVALHELGQFEDIVQDGTVRPGVAALWFSEAADAWDDYQHSLGAGKRSLYIAIRHQQLPLDCILDGDDLKPYRVLYLTDRHVSRAGSKAIVEWVKAGGCLFATAGAGMFDEFNQPNKVLRELLGVDETALEHAAEPEEHGDATRRHGQNMPGGFVESQICERSYAHLNGNDAGGLWWGSQLKHTGTGRTDERSLGLLLAIRS